MELSISYMSLADLRVKEIHYNQKNLLKVADQSYENGKHDIQGIVYDNVIIGGGPGGLNLAMEFTVRGIPYILLERSSSFSGQFRYFPRCRELISLNKKHLPAKSPWSYARRYDWHTLSTITEEDSKKDPKLLFTNWSDSLFPEAERFADYLDYVGNHPNWGITKHTHFKCEVTSVTRNNLNQFEIKTALNETFVAKRLYMATGATRPVVPNIRGILEHGIFYRDFDPADIERYRNKRVVILGGGNSAFEVANSLKAIAGDTVILIRSTLKFARQTHNVHDVRTQASVSYDLAQLKSLTAISAERVTEIKRHEDGRLILKTSTPDPHWETPMWRHRDLMTDYVIVCCGFNYFVPEVFNTEHVRPEIDETGKFCKLTSSWESVNVPNLYFVGGSMRVNDRDAASGFVHGFRYNIQALASIVAERYHKQPLAPLFQCVLDPKNDGTFEPLSQFIVQTVSLTAPLFELFNYGCCTVTIKTMHQSDITSTPTYMAEVWEVFPQDYARQRWADNNTWVGRVEVYLKYGFNVYGDDIPTHHFTHPADNFHTEKSAYIHPVLYSFQHNKKSVGKCSDYSPHIEEWHMQESLFARWDVDDYDDEGTNIHQFTNTVYNAIAAVLDMPNRKSTLPMYDDFINRGYTRMTADEVEQALQQEPGLRMLLPNKTNASASVPAATKTTDHRSCVENAIANG
ncbi:unnamed protein product [Adineta ricciae]|uniref:Uncharacterized protein n=1 Tax=Adineta ricciae TaxID=249248 RepID=A0A814AV18_ADIRI|nr:unnamed protein product [Adineta ricciae]CAF1490478.1 unnamed protein product [Adineta ricciae]